MARITRGISIGIILWAVAINTLPTNAALVSPPLGATPAPTTPCDGCVASHPGDNDFCGTDGRSYRGASGEAVSCCASHGVNVLYAGMCECPNNCTSGWRGVCVGDDTSPGHLKCGCHAGWGGADCMSVRCPENSCSGHGTCDGTAVPHMCVCDPGWSGPDCAAATPPYTDVPWGCAAPAPHVDPADGGCAQPLSQIPWVAYRALPQLRLNLSNSDLVSLMHDIHNDTKRPADIAYLGGGSAGQRVLLRGASIRLKGHGSRNYAKKGFNIYLKDTTGNASWAKKKLCAKAAFNLLGAQLTTTLLQTVGSPVLRSSFALLFFNDRYMGLYKIYGSTTHGFENYWFGPDAEDRGEIYKSAGYLNPPFGDCDPRALEPSVANVTDYCEISRIVINGTQAEFNASVPKRVDLDAMARVLVVATFVQLGDSIIKSSGGNNYAWFNTNISTRPGDIHWSAFIRDFDWVYLTTGDIYAFIRAREFGRKLLGCRNFTEPFHAHYRALLRAVKGNSTTTGGGGNVTAAEWYGGLVPLLGPYATADAMVRLSSRMIPSWDLAKSAAERAEWLPRRIAEVEAMLARGPEA